MKPLTISRTNPSLLSSNPFCSSFLTFKLPIISRRSVGFRCESLRRSDTGEDSNGVSLRRREMIVSLSTLRLVIGLQYSLDGVKAAIAAESGESAYLSVKEEVRKVVSKGKAAGVLRLAFHDAGTFEISGTSEATGGMNGSIIYELDRPENTGLNKSVKASVSGLGSGKGEKCSGCDATRQPDAEGRLPRESLDAAGLKQCFQRKGFSTQELVALSGAHTLGSKGFGDPVVFDNSYYKILLKKPWTSPGGSSSMIGLPSDHALMEDNECLRWIELYADDQDAFFQDFKNAYIKLVNSGATWKGS
ncbi:unnamed protein product [Linum tenue]|uniref:Plant heme peroxidase family profile domain-containing protein n=1 Tax=Linum tenue TaxID=586396 RepID=A0AAV0JYV1_9ROSI|nr:unnamed protein product [Linum tenue]